MSASLARQLSGIRHQVQKEKPRCTSLNQPFRSPMLWELDGGDHINMLSTSLSELGQFLAMSSKVPFTHSIFKRFACVDAFRHWISSLERDDAIRNMYGPRLYNFSRQLTQARIVNVRAIVMDANWQRIQQNPALAKALKESTLPLDCYFIDRASSLRTRPGFGKWFVWGMEEIRRALKEDRDPDFSQLLDKPNSGIYDFAFELPGGGNGSQAQAAAAQQAAVPAVKTEPKPSKKKNKGKSQPKPVQETTAEVAVPVEPAPALSEIVPSGTDLSGGTERVLTVSRNEEGVVVTDISIQHQRELIANR